jgi:hypothetical protein
VSLCVTEAVKNFVGRTGSTPVSGSGTQATLDDVGERTRSNRDARAPLNFLKQIFAKDKRPAVFGHVPPWRARSSVDHY